jgi:hypothetical protein
LRAFAQRFAHANGFAERGGERTRARQLAPSARGAETAPSPYASAFTTAAAARSARFFEEAPILDATAL